MCSLPDCFATGAAALVLLALAVAAPSAAQDKPVWRADWDVGTSVLSTPDPDWSDISVSLRRIGSEQEAGFQISQARRFGRSEYLVGATFQTQNAHGVTLEGSLAVGGNNRFLPDWRATGHVGLRARQTPTHTDVIGLASTIASYDRGTFLTIAPGATRYFAARNAFIGVDAIAAADPDGHWRWGARANAGADLRPGLAARAWLGVTPESEQGRFETVRSAALGLVFDATASTSLRFTLSAEDRNLGPDRVTLSAGFSRNF